MYGAAEVGGFGVRRPCADVRQLARVIRHARDGADPFEPSLWGYALEITTFRRRSERRTGRSRRPRTELCSRCRCRCCRRRCRCPGCHPASVPAAAATARQSVDLPMPAAPSRTSTREPASVRLRDPLRTPISSSLPTMSRNIASTSSGIHLVANRVQPPSSVERRHASDASGLSTASAGATGLEPRAREQNAFLAGV
jgi:hypothetical protein